MSRKDEDRFGAFAACPFCGERIKLRIVAKHMRGGVGEWPEASYVRCLTCNARGPLMKAGRILSDEAAASAWNGEIGEISKIAGGLFE